MTVHVLWVQKWEESEAGWGTRPDGYTLHRSKADIEVYLKAMRDREAAQGYGKHNVPTEYSRPCGDPYEMATSDPAVYQRVLDSDHGIWGTTGNNYPEPIRPGADRTGWVTREQPS